MTPGDRLCVVNLSDDRRSHCSRCCCFLKIFMSKLSVHEARFCDTPQMKETFEASLSSKLCLIRHNVVPRIVM